MAEPLVLIPGMMCDARLFLPQIAALSAQRAISVANVTGQDTIEEMARDVLEAAPERFALLGQSMGGIVAMEVLRRAPERVTRLALVSTSAQAESPAQAAEREPLIVRAKAGRLDAVIQETMRSDCLAPGPARPGTLAVVREMAATLGPDVFTRQSRALQRRPDQQKTLRMVRAPAMVISGAHDSLTPLRRQEFIADLMPNATHRVIGDAGHLPSLETPGALLEILRDWLGELLVLR